MKIDPFAQSPREHCKVHMSIDTHGVQESEPKRSDEFEFYSDLLTSCAREQNDFSVSHHNPFQFAPQSEACQCVVIDDDSGNWFIMN